MASISPHACPGTASCCLCVFAVAEDVASYPQLTDQNQFQNRFELLILENWQMIITKLTPAKFLSAELTALQINVASVSKIIKLITHKKELMQQKISVQQNQFACL